MGAFNCKALTAPPASEQLAQPSVYLFLSKPHLCPKTTPYLCSFKDSFFYLTSD